MNGGLDQQVQQKVDAYRGNPQALMQRYQQNQQLLDLLALQKLKSEKEAAARQMQLQMQQTPQTVAQQREQEVLGLTKQELAQQTQGILQQRQSQQQQNLQRVAQGGIGSLAPQRAPAPAPQGQPMPRMAGGGIVSFQPGGSVSGVTYSQWRSMSRSERERAGLPVSEIGGQLYFNRFGVGLGLNDRETGERIAVPGVTTPFGRRAGELLGRVGGDFETERLRQRVQMKYGRQGGVAGLFQPQTDQQRARAQEIIRNLDNYSRAELEMLLVDDMSDIGRPPGVPADYQPGTVAQIVPEGVPAGFTRPLPEGAAFAAEDRGPRPIVLPDIQGPPAPPGPGPDFELTGRQPSPEVPAGPGAAGPDATTPSGDGGLASLGVGLGLGGPEAAMRRGFATADEYLGRGEKAARYAEMEAELARLDEGVAERARDPNRRLTEFLLGGGGQSSAAGALGAAGRALLAYDDRIDRQERDRLISRISLSERGMTIDSELGRAGLELGRVMFSEAAQNQRATMEAANTLRVEELRQMREDARQQATELRLDRAYKLDQLKYELDVAKENRAARGESYAAAVGIANYVSAARKEAIDSLLSTDQNYLMARMRESQAESPEERQQAEAAVNAIINMAVLRANMMLDATDEDGGLSMLAMEQQALELMYNRYFSDAGISPEDVTGTSYTE